MRIEISHDEDIINARSSARAILQGLYFSNTLVAFTLTAISEIARNIIHYAGKGVIEVKEITSESRTGIEVIATDQGPGISNIEDAMRDGFSTSNSLGLGLPGVKRMMNEFSIESTLGHDTKVRFMKWRQANL